MNRLFFTFNNNDEYFAKTTEIDDTTKAIITALYPHIKANRSFTFTSISIGNQAPNDETEYVTVRKNNNGVVDIEGGESLTGSMCERIFIDNCAGVEYYGTTYDLAKRLNLAFMNDGVNHTDSKNWFNKQQEIMKHSKEAIEREICLVFSDKKEVSGCLTGMDKETQKILNTECPDVSPKFNNLSFNVMSDICDEILSTLKKKNDDYGNSYIKNIERFGKQAMLIPMFNKLDRLESLSKKENQNFESFEDSLKDLMGYCLMATQYLIKTRGK